jgi:hypothetical protein
MRVEDRFARAGDPVVATREYRTRPVVQGRRHHEGYGEMRLFTGKYGLMGRPPQNRPVSTAALARAKMIAGDGKIVCPGDP